MKPINKPTSPNFSSGPCAKHPGYDLSKLPIEILGRSHRSAVGKATLKKAIDLSRKLLDIPEDYLLGIVPASDTGAMEMALWSLLGERAVDVCYWESFGEGWMNDICNELQLENVNHFKADYGKLPDLANTNSDNDIVFTWNGTTSGVKVPDAEWIDDNRSGLTICDATSAVFAMELPWHKLDVVTYSWQKVLGSEGGHGILILSPRAVARLESYKPNRPLPKIFRLLKGGKINKSIFEGATINTPSMLAVLDYIDALEWVEKIGGRQELIHRSKLSLTYIYAFVQDNDWIEFLAEDITTCSQTSVCLKLSCSDEKIKQMLKLLADENIAYDISSYRDAPNGIRIWIGSTVEPRDVEILLDWLLYSYEIINV